MVSTWIISLIIALNCIIDDINATRESARNLGKTFTIGEYVTHDTTIMPTQHLGQSRVRHVRSAL